MKRTIRRTASPTPTARTIRDLSELIAALDRRVPQVERNGEASIARAAGKLKAEAMQRLADLKRNAVRGTSPFVAKVPAKSS
jgi:hypothetical protein